ncbi:MAG: hypothetical protein M3Y37_11655 [Chloroflexota bacterium]|jgi:hypothetical protein|nr:hypothetical protein [Chloroflexota bacterium]
MRGLSLSLRDVPWPGRVVYGVVVGVCAVIMLYGLREGPIFLSVATLIVLIPFVIAAPYVFAGRWKTPQRRPTRRPVVRRRRH